MAIDRQNPQLDLFFDPHHPAVLRMISLVMENAHKAGIWAGICGELGADQSLTKRVSGNGSGRAFCFTGKYSSTA